MKRFVVIKTLLLFVLVITVMGCREKKDTFVEVYVVDDQGKAVTNATVELLTSPPYELNSIPVLNKTEVSNESGIALFNFNDVYKLGQAGVAVLDVEVTKGNQMGHGIVKVEQEMTTKERIVVFP
jgi:hypothetical protein